MKKRLQGMLAGLMLGVIMTMGINSYAKTGSEWIEAIYSNIKIFVEGKQISGVDANGNVVEPFIYNGTTYLPVRTIGEAFGKSVSWDGVAKSVYIGAKPNEVKSWMDTCKPYDYYGGTEYLLSQNKSFEMSGKEYTNGFTLMCYQSSKSQAMFNLNGKYNSLTFKVGHVDGTQLYDAELNIYLDGVLVKEETLIANRGTKNITIPLNGAMHMMIEIEEIGPHYMTCRYGFAEGVFN